MKKKPKFLLLGWDAADWKVINPLIDKGQMPALESILNNGCMGNIATLDPPLSPMLWTSIATGKHAYKHGVHGFLEGNANKTRVRPVTQESIQTKTVWNMLNEKGFKTNVVGWWPSHPARPLNGAQISNFHAKVPETSTWHNWPLIANAVYPESIADEVNKLRVHPGELGFEQLSSFIPHLDRLRKEDQKLLNHLLVDIAECITVHATSTYLADHCDWDFMAVYYNAIDHISHIFMKYHPPQLPWIDDQSFDLYSEVINSVYRWHDMMLGRWLDMVGEDCYVMVLSDHGFHSDERRVKALPKEPAAIAREHNHLGILAIKGPGIKKDDLIFGASLLDITPTILSAFNLPIGKDMDGKVLNAIFEKAPDLEVVDSWDDKIKSQHSSSLAQFESDELVKQLVDLGYVEQEDTGSPEAVKKLLDENNFYLSRSYFEARKFKESRMILHKLCNDYPENHRYWFQLARVCVEQNDPDGLQDSISHLKSIVNPGSQGIQLLEGKLAYLSNNFEQALRIFKSIGQGEGLMNAHIVYQIATTLLKLHQYEEALKFYKKHNSLNANNPNALHGMGMAYIGIGSYAKAIDVLIDSIGMMYFNPSAHFHLGKAFRFNGNPAEAEQAFLVAKHLAPAMSKARLELISLYENELKNEAKVISLKREMKQTSRGVVYIVSGLPRSGTSMMMQMLEAGGFQIFSDKKRQADDNNPRGYLEHEAIKRLASDSSVIYQAEGKVVKVIVNLLRFLPANLEYKIILMRRQIGEIIQSQERMLVNLNKSQAGDSLFEADKKWQASLEKSISYINKQPNMDVLEVNYAEVLEDPLKQAEKVQSFLGFPLELDRVTQIVEQDLYRAKI